MVSQTMFSSASSEWETPQLVFDYLNHRYNFRVDPCATKENHKCEIYFTKETDGLKQNWHQYRSVFMNPVYGNHINACEPNCTKRKCKERGYHIDEYVPGIDDWMTKAFAEAQEGAFIACLVPSRTDTGWWYRYCMNANEIWFIKQRLSFINRTLPAYNVNGVLKVAPAPFPSAVVIFDGIERGIPAHPILKAMTIDKRTGLITVQ